MSQVIYQDLIIRNTAIFWNSISFFKNDAGVFYASCCLEIKASLTMFKGNESRYKQCGVAPHFPKTKK